MADPNHPHPQFGQPFQQQFRPPNPNQGVQNRPPSQGPPGQGPPKMPGMPPPPMPGQQYAGVPPNSYANMGPPRGQGPPQRFNNGPSGPPPMGGNVNGFAPPTSMQGPVSQGPMSMNRSPGPPTSVGSGPPQSQGNFRPSVSGQFVPPSSSYNSSAPPPLGAGHTVNGTSNTAPVQGFQQPMGQPPSRYAPPPMSHGGPMPGPPRLPTLSPAGSMAGPPRMGMPGPPSTGAPPAFSNSASGASTPNSGLIKPPSQRSSRGPSPVNEQSIDALEGQFSPGQATPTSQAQSRTHPGSSPFPGPSSQGSPIPFQPPQGQPGTGPPPRQGMPGPPRPGMPGPPSVSGSNVATVPPMPQTMGQQQRLGYMQSPMPYPGSMPPTSGAYGQPGPPTRPPGPPTGPFNVRPPPTSQAPGPGSNYYQPSQPPQGMPGPPTGPPSGPPTRPTGPYNQPHAGQGYPQPGQGYQQPGQGYQQPGQSYPQPGQNAVNNMAGDFNKMAVQDSQRALNLMQEKKLISPEGVEAPKPSLYHDHKRVNCNPEVFRCTLNAIPQNSSLLNKARLPLGILIHPFKDLSQLPVIQSSVIVRCRSCRTYINPFVTFVDQRRWKCNLCFRVNELPDEFSFDPVTKTYGDPQRRPEIKSATIEFIAPSEYMLRPPQPAVYLFVLDVSFNAIETGYLRLFSQTLLEELERLPGDARMQIGFLCFDRSLYFFNLSEGLSQPQMMVVPDLEDVFLPTPDSLLVNLHECREMVVELLNQLPGLFEGNHETGNALGSALQAAYKLMHSTGGRITVMQTILPTVGPGALENREASSQAASLNSSNLGPASDFYKKLALDCSAQQVAVDLFLLNGQYADIATVACISKYSAGSVQYYPSFHTVRNPAMSDKFESDLRRYLTRKVGFEAVMRIRCTRGVSIHTFHGNFFVRSTDLLSLPNVNPDAGFGMQMSIEENLTESSNVCFQAALLYTSSKGERRIRVHSLAVPITNQLSDVFAGADQQAIASLLAKMAADRTVSSSLEDARDAMMNACQDMMNAYATQIPASQRAGALMVPYTLRLVPLFVLAMLKSTAFRLSPSIKVDERVFAHLLAKTLPTSYLLQTYYPHLYPVHNLNDENVIERNNEKVPKAPRLQLSSANIDRHGVYVMDQGENMFLMVGGAVSDVFCQEVFDMPNFMSIPEGMADLPELENPTSERLRCFISHLMDSRPGGVTFLVLREDSKLRNRFFQYMVEDRTESSMSYYEFLQFVQQKIKG
ncbi:protein transport protein Sec24A-like isoform X2 [Littorina saxatilis]|uniref:protein transport protein Sec24A-like isoform X2 n=1 Tax=Littorina saxatilis TaxID=31220 RepID=UPI0038B6A934